MKMNIEWDKVTWYSKALAVLLFLLTFYVGFKLGVISVRQTDEVGVVVIERPIGKDGQGEKSTTISISSENIKEKNFEGSVPVFTGSGSLVVVARDYVANAVREFKEQADIDVPDMREEFGPDSPTANYTIEIGAEYLSGQKTESIIIDVYAYTGGANGNSSYRVFTADRDNGKILKLGDVIKSEEQTAFAELVKKELQSWRPEGTKTAVVFPEEVKKLTFSSFADWSLDAKEENLILYFDKYEIGPGALGSVAFPIPIAKISKFLAI